MFSYIYNVVSSGFLYIANGASSVYGSIADLFNKLTYFSLYDTIQNSFIYKTLAEYLGMLWKVIEFIMDILNISLGSLKNIMTGIYDNLFTTQTLVIIFCILILWIAGYLLKAFTQPIYWVLRPFVILLFKSLKFFFIKLIRTLKRELKKQLRKYM